MARKKTKSPKKLYIAAASVAVILIAIGAYALFHNSPTSGTIPATTANTASKGSSAASQDTAASNSSNAPANQTASQPDKTGSNISGSGSGPVKPFGTFISNHFPSLSGPSDQLQEESVCNTTAGASCGIQFMMGGVTKTLEAQTTDSSGTAYWKWDVSTAGLTVGTWQVVVTASLNGQSLSSSDTLVVSQ